MISDEDAFALYPELKELPDVIPGLLRMEAWGHLSRTPNRKFRGLVNPRDRRFQIFRGTMPTGFDCDRHMTLFQVFDTVPESCYSCYKLVVQPRTVVELLKLVQAFEQLELPRDNIRKCMVETRDFVAGTYKGYLYCQNLQEAQEVHDIVRSVVNEDLSPDVPIKLVRGCNEYNIGMEDRYNEDRKPYEEFVDKWFEFDHSHAIQDNVRKEPFELLCVQYWLSYAASIGDQSYLLLTGGRELEPLEVEGAPRRCVGLGGSTSVE